MPAGGERLSIRRGLRCGARVGHPSQGFRTRSLRPAVMASVPRAPSRTAHRKACKMAVPISARSAGARRRLRRRLPAVLLATILGTLLLMVAGTIAAGPAQAAAFRYWGYFSWQAGKWEFSQVGADQTKPADGGVEGWRFAISPAEGSPRVPRTTGDFSAICGSTPVVGGKK